MSILFSQYLSDVAVFGTGDELFECWVVSKWYHKLLPWLDDDEIAGISRTWSILWTSECFTYIRFYIIYFIFHVSTLTVKYWISYVDVLPGSPDTRKLTLTVKHWIRYVDVLQGSPDTGTVTLTVKYWIRYVDVLQGSPDTGKFTLTVKYWIRYVDVLQGNWRSPWNIE